MALTNKLVKQVDLPVWEWMRFTPVTTSSLTALTTARDGTDRYLYYFGSNVLYRYDTWGDTWQQLSTNATPVTTLAAQYTSNQGYEGRVLSTPGVDTLQIPSTNVKNLVGYAIRIVSGTGVGQERTITAVADEVTHESGVVTSVTNSQVTDTTRRWRMNQWVGYSVKLVFNTGFSQYRTIVYNNENSATVFDANYDGRLPWMSAFSSTAPYAAPVTTAGSQAHFTITSQVITVDSAWSVSPDTTSRFEILSGGIWWVTSNASSPFFTFAQYDILGDRFINKVNSAGIFPAALGTDWSIVPFSEKLLGNLETGTATSGTSRTLVDNTKTWTKGQFKEFSLHITGGTGDGQSRRIISNSVDTITVSPAWDTPPDNTSTYHITMGNEIMFTGGGRAQLLQYLPGPSVWSSGNLADYGLVPNQLALTRGARLPHSLTTAARALNGITGVNATPTAAGINYVVGDVLTVSTGGTLGRVYVESVNPQTGAVLSISLFAAGSNYTVGTGRATTGGSGGGCTVEITSVGTIGVLTTSVPHDMKLGDSVTFVGATEAAWNTTYNIIGIQSQTIVEVVVTALSNAASLYAQATNLLVDNTKNWVPNEFTGKLLGVQSNGLAGAITWRRIIGNSATTISFIAGTAATNGTSRYYIQDLEAFGKDQMFLADDQGNQGYATAGAIGSLTDSTKNWYPAAFNSTRIEVQNIDGTRMEDIIANNTATVLTTGVSVMGGNGANSIAYSYDKGVTWTSSSSPYSSFCYGLCWTGTRFIAVGSGGLNTIAYSENGLSWTTLGAAIFSTAGQGVAWNGVRAVAVGVGTNTIAWSNDGLTWNGVGTSIFSVQGNAVAWSGTRWVAVGSGTNTIAYSTDGVTWTGIGTAIFSTAGNAVCWAGTQFIAVGQGTNTIATSADGITWTGLGVGTFATAGRGVIWNGTTAVAVGNGTNTIAYSGDNGATWTGIGSLFFTTQGNGVFWNGTNFIAGGSGTNVAGYSTDGITWTPTGTTGFSSLGLTGASTTPFQSVVPSIGIIPNANSYYRIMDSYGSASAAGLTTNLNDSSKKWKVNQWAGKRVIITSGTGAQQESTISSNTATQITFGAISSATDNSSTYTILGVPARGAGITASWNWDTTETANKGRYIFVPRGGGSHTFDRFNVSTNQWTYGWFIYGQGETLTTGSMYVYDGDRIYYQKDATGRIFYYDIIKNEINGFGMVPYGMGAAILGNRMEIIKTTDNLKYLYVMRHTGTEMWRTIILF